MPEMKGLSDVTTTTSTSSPLTGMQGILTSARPSIDKERETDLQKVVPTTASPKMFLPGAKEQKSIMEMTPEEVAEQYDPVIKLGQKGVKYVGEVFGKLKEAREKRQVRDILGEAGVPIPKEVKRPSLLEKIFPKKKGEAEILTKYLREKREKEAGVMEQAGIEVI